MAKKRKKTATLDPTLPIYQVRIALNDVRPPIWRRVQVNDCSLDELHTTIQVCMGWEDCHMHAFEVGGVEYGNPEIGGDLDYSDSRSTRLSDSVEQGCDTFLYEYDFGDDWKHTIKIEKTLLPEQELRYPRCVEGKRACPPEDCGGPWGYSSFLEAVQDQRHKDHDEMLEWCGGEFDPEYFDLDAVNEELRYLRTWLGRTKGKYSSEPTFAVGDQVRVKAGIVHPEYDDIPLGGWVGRVSRIAYLTPNGYLVRWSAETLGNVHPVYSKRCERDEADPRVVWLDEDDLKPDQAEPLSIEQPTNIITRALSTDNQDDRVRAVFGLTSDDPLPRLDEDTQQQYCEYLKTRLSFPFDAEYWPDAEAVRGVTVTGMEDESSVDVDTGIMCEIQQGQRKSRVPLRELTVEEDNPNDPLLDDYSYWFFEGQEEDDVDEFDDDDGEFEDDYDYGDDEFGDEYEEELSAPPQYPIGTIALYGPDDKITTKIAAGVIVEESAEAIIERWVGTDVKDNPKVQIEIEEFFKRHNVKSVVATEINMGCPHEEGEDFPVGEDCPFCPFWKGKQGSGQED